MRTHAELAVMLLEHGRSTLQSSLERLTLAEALDPAGGYRSVLGILKHAAAWSRVYHSYAFDPSPKHWAQTDWPRGLRDTIQPEGAYLDLIIAWNEEGCAAWLASIAGLPDEALDAPRPCHWGATMPLFDIVALVFNHWSYHAGEINALLAIIRGHAWEYTEEVEENHISTAGHRVRPAWMNDEQVARYEAYIAKRDEAIRRG